MTVVTPKSATDTSVRHVEADAVGQSRYINDVHHRDDKYLDIPAMQDAIMP